MKVSRKKNNRIAAPKHPIPFLYLDEYHLISGSLPSMAIASMDRPGRRRILATQAVFTGKSGKTRSMGSVRYEDTGERVKPMPTKFYPAQVIRRQKEICSN